MNCMDQDDVNKGGLLSCLEVKYSLKLATNTFGPWIGQQAVQFSLKQPTGNINNNNNKKTQKKDVTISRGSSQLIGCAKLNKYLFTHCKEISEYIENYSKQHTITTSINPFDNKYVGLAQTYISLPRPVKCTTPRYIEDKQLYPLPVALDNRTSTLNLCLIHINDNINNRYKHRSLLQQQLLPPLATRNNTNNQTKTKLSKTIQDVQKKNCTHIKFGHNLDNNHFINFSHSNDIPSRYVRKDYDTPEDGYDYNPDQFPITDKSNKKQLAGGSNRKQPTQVNQASSSTPSKKKSACIIPKLSSKVSIATTINQELCLNKLVVSNSISPNMEEVGPTSSHPSSTQLDSTSTLATNDTTKKINISNQSQQVRDTSMIAPLINITPAKDLNNNNNNKNNNTGNQIAYVPSFDHLTLSSLFNQFSYKAPLQTEDRPLLDSGTLYTTSLQDFLYYIDNKLASQPKKVEAHKKDLLDFVQVRAVSPDSKFHRVNEGQAFKSTSGRNPKYIRQQLKASSRNTDRCTPSRHLTAPKVNDTINGHRLKSGIKGKRRSLK